MVALSTHPRRHRYLSLAQTIYENAEVLVTEWKATFPANTARAEGTYAVVEWNKLKDGQIISHRTGMTSIPTSAI